MSVKFVPAVTRPVIETPAKIVVELTVEQAARYHALLGKLTGKVDYELYSALAEALPKKAQLICERMESIAMQDFAPRF